MPQVVISYNPSVVNMLHSILLIAALVFPLAIWWLDDVTVPQLVAILCCSAAVVYTHRSNIVRILKGREDRLW